jgi:uncharacterized protein YndB with AHSA1/START domain
VTNATASDTTATEPTATDTMTEMKPPHLLHVDEAPTESGRTVSHGTFVLERTYRHAPRTVFDAWAVREKKHKWFPEAPDFLASIGAYELDFRVGGREHLDGLFPSGSRFEYDSIYDDIVDDRRIVATYDVRINEKRISVSLLTVEFEPTEDGGTHLVMTEQGAFLDGMDTNDERIKGADESLDGLDAYLDTMAI